MLVVLALLKTFEAPDQAIVAVGIEELASTAKLMRGTSVSFWKNLVA